MGNDVVVVDEAATAEINATGKVGVYGYNLRVPSAGTYEITYTVPNVNITAPTRVFVGPGGSP